MKTNKQSGFIALISSVIISAILITLLFATNTSTFYTRFDVLDRENKKISSNLAEACINKALLALAEDYSYDPIDSTIVVDGGNNCTIKSVTPHAPRLGSITNVVIQTQGVYRSTYSNLVVNASIQNPASSNPAQPNMVINSWIEQ